MLDSAGVVMRTLFSLLDFFDIRGEVVNVAALIGGLIGAAGSEYLIQVADVDLRIQSNPELLVSRVSMAEYRGIL